MLTNLTYLQLYHLTFLNIRFYKTDVKIVAFKAYFLSNYPSSQIINNIESYFHNHLDICSWNEQQFCTMNNVSIGLFLFGTF